MADTMAHSTEPLDDQGNDRSSAEQPAASVCDAGDIARSFQVFLGRQPDQASLAELAPLSFPEVLRAIFESDDFKDQILRSVLLREDLPHLQVAETPSLPLIDWVQQQLPMGAETRIACGGVRRWEQLLELLLSDAELTALAPHLCEAEVDEVLRQRLENEPWSKIKRNVIGAMDAASAFEIRGWAVNLCDKSTPVTLEFYADNLFLGTAVCNESRPDVQDAVGGDGRVGFTFKVSTANRTRFAGGRILTAVDSISRSPISEGTMVFADPSRNWDTIERTRSELAQLREVLDRIEERLPELARLSSIPLEAYDEYWERFYRLTPDTIAEQRTKSSQLAYRPLISVVLPTWNSDTRLLAKAIDSVRAQTYDRWELLVTDDASENDQLRRLRTSYPNEPRIRWLDADSRGGIAVNTNRGIAASQGDYIAFLDHDDELALDGLFHIALALQDRKYGLIYSDEDRIEEPEGRCVHHTPFFKPNFDSDLLLAHNFICHLAVLRRDVVDAVGGLRGEFEGAQDHDFLLRAVAHLRENEILHLPRVLYHWRVTPGSVSRTPGAAAKIQANIVTAVTDQITRLNLSATVEDHDDPHGVGRAFAARVRWNLPPVAPKVSIIIPTRDRVDLLRPCLQSVINSLGHYRGDSEVLLVDNDSIEQETFTYLNELSAVPKFRAIRFRGPFNWSAMNNAAAAEATGEVLIFLNNDTVVLSQNWCEELAANAIRKDVGAVGARLLYADGTIQHAGVVLGVEGVAGHESVGEDPATGGYFGRSHILHSVAAVTGACLATRRDLFRTTDGGFDEMNLKVAFNDVDYCMRVRKAGYRVIYNPYATLYHLESKSRGRDWSEAQMNRHREESSFFRRRWSRTEMLDPYYNLHFERFARPFERLRPPPDLMMK